MATANFSISEALETLRTSIPKWNERLDELNGQIAQRQIELARLDYSSDAREENGQRPPSNRSLRNKGSTESLRPKEADDNNPFALKDTADFLSSPSPTSPKCTSPKQQHSPFSLIRRSSSSVKRGITSKPPNSNENHRESPTSTPRQASNNKSPQAHPKNVLRKRRTESIASGESVITTKPRTRSMIIVYYDSAVQTAFEDLVKFVSGSRNSMRKGKMAAKMAEMKRAAELEFEQDDEEKDSNHSKSVGNGNFLEADENAISHSLVADPLAAGDDEDEDMGLPQLKFVSTRQIGPPKASKGPEPSSRLLGAGMRLSYRRAGDSSPDIFDELDKDLEWCQSQCEAGAHNFLREGKCATEITNIKMKLAEVKAKAEKEIERLKKEPPTPTSPTTGRPNLSVNPPRGFKQPQVRKEFATTKELEVDDEMDDEGLGEMENPPKLVFKRSGQ